MQIDLQFWNKEQQDFYWSQFRNNEFDGAFANGKSYVICMRAFTHLMLFPKYAYAFCRQEYKSLRSTTMKTFFKICPDKLIHRHDEQNGYTVFVNGSFIYWMHLDQYDEQDLRGLEINSAGIDQGEEIHEPIYNVLDSRIGRWDQARVPDNFLSQLLDDNARETLGKLEKDNPSKVSQFIQTHTKWPRHPRSGRFLVHNYLDIGCNIADDEEFHWTYRYYNPESSERKPDHFYIHRVTDASMDDEKTYQQKLLRDPEWVNKYVYGKRGASSAIIHKLDKQSVINPKDIPVEEFNQFIKDLKKKSALYRILDHGETGVTACGWLAIWQGRHIFYREYYIEGQLISNHRKALSSLSENEEYQGDFADPQIFKKTQQSISGTKAGFWTVAQEYSDTDGIDAPPIYWEAADNDEFATRNRINELLQLQPRFVHPITKVSPAPGLYFIAADKDLYSYGIQEGIKQIKIQRRLLLGEDNGKKIYSIERDPKIVDHAYDYIRYGVAMHNVDKTEPKRKPPRMSFEYYSQVLKRRPKFVHASSD